MQKMYMSHKTLCDIQYLKIYTTKSFLFPGYSARQAAEIGPASVNHMCYKGQRLVAHKLRSVWQGS